MFEIISFFLHIRRNKVMGVERARLLASLILKNERVTVEMKKQAEILLTETKGISFDEAT